MKGRLSTLGFALILSALISSGCAPTTLQPTPVPTWDWRTSTPEEQGMDSAKLDEMMEYINELDLPIDSVIVVRHGYTVVEEYPNLAYSHYALHNVHCVTKSVTSALIGIAIEEAFIESADQKVVDFFPERGIKNLDSRKQNMTLEHLLTMSSGLEWDERSYPQDDKRNTNHQMWQSGENVQFVLDRPMASDPGVQWVYNSGGSQLAGAIREAAPSPDVAAINPGDFKSRT